MEAGTPVRREGQEGSRWVNARPSGEDVAGWFEDNVTLHHDDLKHDDYVQGITLIVQKQKEPEVVDYTEAGVPVIDERENLVYVPYSKVETRVKYFWDVCRALDAVGFIEPVAPPKPSASLPFGFYRFDVTNAQNARVGYVACTMRATIYERGSIKEIPYRDTETGEMKTRREGTIIMQGAPGSKMVPVLARYGPDNNALMKAETGAVGRALGLLGMLVVPGSGVATAEDMQEAMAVEGGPTQAVPPQTGEQAKLDDDDAVLRKRATALIEDLGKIDKPRLDRFRAWVKERGITGLATAESPQLRGLIRKLEEEIAEAQKPAEEEKPEEEPEGDAEAEKS